MSKRSTEDEIEPKVKVQKLNDESEGDAEEQNQDQNEVGEPENEAVVEPDIFKLDPDCFFEIFDRCTLGTLNDLNAFAQTCKAMQQVAGQYFQKNFKTIQAQYDDGDIYIRFGNQQKLTGFGPFIRRICIRSDAPDELAYFNQNCKDSIENIEFRYITLNAAKIELIKDIVGRAEMIKFYSCKFEGEFYEGFLRFATNLKDLGIENDIMIRVKKK